MTYLLVSGVVVARVCGTPVLGLRSRLGGSLVGRSPSAVARRPADHHTFPVVSSNDDSGMFFVYFTTDPLVGAIVERRLTNVSKTKSIT